MWAFEQNKGYYSYFLFIIIHSKTSSEWKTGQFKEKGPTETVLLYVQLDDSIYYTR